MIKAEEVRRAAQGRWKEIFTDLAPELEAALGRIGRHVPCPVHGGKDGFRLFRDVEDTGGGICNTCGAFHDGFALLGWLKHWRFPEVLGAVAGALRVSHSESVERVLTAAVLSSRPRTPQHRPAEQDNQLRARMRRMWSKAVALSHPQAIAAQRYLQTRKLSVRYVGNLHHAVRFHPGLAYRDESGEIVAEYPAILCVVSNPNSELVTLHRMYLGRDGGKAPVGSPKKLMPVPNGMTVTGASIKLGAPRSPVLGIAEGVETALAVASATGMTVWAAVNATLLESFVPPAGIEQVVIWADLDRSRRGEEAARKLKARLWEKGIKARILLPPMAIPEPASGVDWNDVWLEHGHAGFPNRALLPRVA